MDESRPATAASEEDAAPTNSAPEASAAQTEKPRSEHRRRRVPTPVLVTVLVAALSVWVAPAFTRQWEDQKQARALQAQLAEEIALATARVSDRVDLDIAARADGYDSGVSEPAMRSIVAAWRIEYSRIDAKLRVYFSPALRSLWVNFGDVVITVVDNSAWYTRNPPSTQPFLRDVGHLWERLDLGKWSEFFKPNYERARMSRLDERADPSVRVAMQAVAVMADRIIDRLMTADPEAFSTTRRDLLRDLLP